MSKAVVRRLGAAEMLVVDALVSCGSTEHTFAIVWKLQQMKHFFVLLFLHNVPRDVWEFSYNPSDGRMPLLPARAFQDRVRTLMAVLEARHIISDMSVRLPGIGPI
jgi:hypothetical protein